jgi:hypothetical protein
MTRPYGVGPYGVGPYAAAPGNVIVDVGATAHLQTSASGVSFASWYARAFIGLDFGVSAPPNLIWATGATASMVFSLTGAARFTFDPIPACDASGVWTPVGTWTPVAAGSAQQRKAA